MMWVVAMVVPRLWLCGDGVGMREGGHGDL